MPPGALVCFARVHVTIERTTWSKLMGFWGSQDACTEGSALPASCQSTLDGAWHPRTLLLTVLKFLALMP